MNVFHDDNAGKGCQEYHDRLGVDIQNTGAQERNKGKQFYDKRVVHINIGRVFPTDSGSRILAVERFVVQGKRKDAEAQWQGGQIVVPRKFKPEEMVYHDFHS